MGVWSSSLWSFSLLVATTLSTRMLWKLICGEFGCRQSRLGGGRSWSLGLEGLLGGLIVSSMVLCVSRLEEITMGDDWQSGLRGLCVRSRGLDRALSVLGALDSPPSEILVNVVSVDDNGAFILRGLRAGCASTPCLILDSESSSNMARSDNGRGARISSPVMALWTLFLSTVLGVPGGTQN